MTLQPTVQGQSGRLPLLSAAGVCAHLELEGSPFLKSSAPQKAEKDPEEGEQQVIKLTEPVSQIAEQFVRLTFNFSNGVSLSVLRRSLKICSWKEKKIAW